MSEELRQALVAIIRGDGVKRGRHDLRLEGRDVSGEFVAALASQGYVPRATAELEVEVGLRIPAFLVREGVAYFGWVFWEKFTDAKKRRLWGSVLRNAKGDWAIQLGANDRTPLYANPGLVETTDSDNPSPW
ncbi:MAG: hypothetical protein HYZ53_30330 [Planctomycetes bacterium]|nr:hypothetical protein [Planctomycetota bacterium]